MTLIDFRYKEFTSIVTAFAVVPTQRERSIGTFTLLPITLHAYMYIVYIPCTFSKESIGFNAEEVRQGHVITDAGTQESMRIFVCNFWKP